MASPRSAVSRVVALLLIFTISGAVWAAPARTLKQYDIRAAHKMRPALRRWHNGPSSKTYQPPSTVYHAPRATGRAESTLQPNKAQEKGLGSAFLTTRAAAAAPAEKTANAFAAYRTSTPSFNQRGEGYFKIGSTGHKPPQNERERASND